MRKGELFIAVTYEVEGSSVNYDISNHPYSPGEKACNLLYDEECVTVGDDNKFPLVLKDGRAAIFVSKGKATTRTEE